MPIGVSFSDQTIRVQIDDSGIVHMEIPTGDSAIHMAFPVSQLIKNMAACNRALANWQKRGRKSAVVSFRQDAAESA